MEDLLYRYKFRHLAVATDCVVFGYDGKSLYVLLVERGLEPYKGYWALPGGFLRMDETVEQCAKRELMEETNVTDVYLKQFNVFSDVNRDPRERILSVAFLALVKKSDYRVIGGDDAASAEWFDMNKLPELAFDHKEIIGMAREELQRILKISPIAFKLLDNKFTIGELQRLYEIINETEYDRRNFHKKMLATGLLKPEGVCTAPMRCRAPQMFSFDEDLYNEQQKNKASKKYPFDF